MIYILVAILVTILVVLPDKDQDKDRDKDGGFGLRLRPVDPNALAALVKKIEMKRVDENHTEPEQSKR